MLRLVKLARLIFSPLSRAGRAILNTFFSTHGRPNTLSGRRTGISPDEAGSHRRPGSGARAAKLGRRLSTFLPLLLPGLILLPALGLAETSYQEPSQQQIQAEQQRARRGLHEAQRLLQDPALRKHLEAGQKPLAAPPAKRHAPSFRLPSDLPHDIPIAERALSAVETLQRDAHPHFLDERIRPLVLISFGLPDQQIRKLLAEARRLDAAVYLRGLINDNWKDTIAAFHALAQDDLGSVSIDPTTFQRFQVSRVPTFILPLERINPCTKEGCPPVKHVRATGSTSLTYFLDYVMRTGTTRERHKARAWLATHQEDSP